MKHLSPKTRILTTLFGVVVLSSSPHCFAAGNVADMFSIGTITFAGGGKRDYVSTPFVRPVESNGTGVIASVNSSSSLTLDPDGVDYSGTTQWTGGSGSVDKHFIVEILDGRYIGLVFLIKTQNGNTVTTDEAVLPQDGALEGSAYAIRKDWTLTSLFGTPGSAGFPFNGGASASSSDTINIFVQTSQSFVTYYIKASNNTWINPLGTSAPHARIPYGQGVQVLRRATGDGTLTLSGEVRKARLRRDVGSNKFALLANLSLTPTTLQELNPSIDRANSTAGDTAQVWSAVSGSWVPYYRRNSDGRFVSALGTTNNVPVGAGKVVRISNKGDALQGTTAVTADPKLP
jgi:hypothetical protein